MEMSCATQGRARVEVVRDATRCRLCPCVLWNHVVRDWYFAILSPVTRRLMWEYSSMPSATTKFERVWSRGRVRLDEATDACYLRSARMGA